MANRGWCQIQIRQGSCHCAREACSTNRNRRPIDPGKLTGSTLRWCTRPFDDTFVICSPNLAHHRPRAYLLYTGKISLSQSIAPALGRPFQCIFSDGVCDESSYMVTEVLVLYLVSDLGLKRSVKLVWKRRHLEWNCFHRQYQYLWRNDEKEFGPFQYFQSCLALSSRFEIDNLSPVPPYS